jgi:hypothetical protein
VTVDPMSPSMGTMLLEPKALEPAADHEGRAGAQVVECRAARPVVGAVGKGPGHHSLWMPGRLLSADPLVTRPHLNSVGPGIEEKQKRKKHSL